MKASERRRLLDEYLNTPRAPRGGFRNLVDDPAEARRRYRVCLAHAADPDSPCRLEEIPASADRMLAVRATLGGVRGPLHRCDACTCVLELRIVSGSRCPRGRW